MSREEHLSKVSDWGGWLSGKWRHKRTGTAYVDVYVPFPGCPVWSVRTDAGSVFNVRAVNIELIDE